MRAMATTFRRPARQAAALLLGLAAQAWAATPAQVMVTMSNAPDGTQSLRIDRSQVPAGPVRFVVRNLSADTVHELLVAKAPAGPLPMARTSSRVDERKLEGLEELGDLGPGRSGSLSMRLRPGRYVLFCNEPGHFVAGMHAELTVTE